MVISAISCHKNDQKAEPISEVTFLADKEKLYVANVQLLNLMDSENTMFLLRLQNKDRKEITFEKNDLPFLEAPSSKAGGYVGSGKQDFYLAWIEGEKSFHAFCLLASTKIIMKFECKEIPFGLTTESKYFQLGPVTFVAADETSLINLQQVIKRFSVGQKGSGGSKLPSKP